MRWTTPSTRSWFFGIRSLESDRGLPREEGSHEVPDPLGRLVEEEVPDAVEQLEAPVVRAGSHRAHERRAGGAVLRPVDVQSRDAQARMPIFGLPPSCEGVQRRIAIE